MWTRSRPSLKDRAAAELELRRRSIAKGKGTDREWKLWDPFPVQRKLLDSPAFITGFGGSAGGSKTAGLLLLAYMNHKKSLILRRTYPNLKEVLVRAEDMFKGSPGRYNKNDKVWIFPDGKIIEMGSIQYEQERFNYRGREHDALLIDEVTELPGGWSTLQFLSGWVRSPDPDQFCQIVVTFNPPDENDEDSFWILDTFGPWIDPEHPNPAESGEIRYFATLKDQDTEVDSPEPFYVAGDERIYVKQVGPNQFVRKQTGEAIQGRDVIVPRSRTFIRATLEDNPVLSATDYRQTLMGLPEPLRSQLLHGIVPQTGYENPWQVIPGAWVDLAMKRWKEKQDRGWTPGVMTAMGVDVSRGGKDKSTISRVHEEWFDEIISFPGREITDGGILAALVIKHRTHDAHINIDVVGVGSAAYDALAPSYPITGLSSGSSATKRSTDKSGLLGFKNKRAEMWWVFREALDPTSGYNICLPPDKELKSDLCAPRWKVVPPLKPKGHEEELKGLILIESKDDIKKRLGRSPDKGDCVIYGWQPPENDGYGNLDQRSEAIW